MSAIKPVGDLVEFAKDMQLWLMGEPLHRRVELAEDALRHLGHYTVDRNEEEASYVLDSNLSYWLTNGTDPKPPIVFGSLAVEGRFDAFTYFGISGIVAEHSSLNSLCISLKGVVLLPDGDRLPADDAVHFPVLGVDRALRVA